MPVRNAHMNYPLLFTFWLIPLRVASTDPLTQWFGRCPTHIFKAQGRQQLEGSCLAHWTPWEANPANWAIYLLAGLPKLICSDCLIWFVATIPIDFHASIFWSRCIPFGVPGLWSQSTYCWAKSGFTLNMSPLCCRASHQLTSKKSFRTVGKNRGARKKSTYANSPLKGPWDLNQCILAVRWKC